MDEASLDYSLSHKALLAEANFARTLEVSLKVSRGKSDENSAAGLIPTDFLEFLTYEYHPGDVGNGQISTNNLLDLS